MIKLGKRQIVSLFIVFFYLVETAYPQPITLAPPSSFEKTRILVVCTGNTCRSPLASALLKKYLPEIALQQVEITSAGIAATPGDPASHGAIGEAEREGIVLSDHKATHLTQDMIRNADIILVMTNEHLGYVKSLAPDKVFLFAVDTEIPDPMSGEISYPEVTQIIKDSIPRLKLLLSGKFPYLRKGIDPEWELWQEAVNLANSEGWDDKKRCLTKLSHNWENPYRQKEAIRILINTLRWGGLLDKTARDILAKIGTPAVPEILAVLETEPGRSSYVYDLLEALGEIKDPLAVDFLVGLFLRPDFPYREIERTLYKIGDPRIVEKVLDLVINKGRRDTHIIDSLRWLGRLDIKRMYLAWQHAEPEIRSILFEIILQMSSEISLGPLLLSIRDAEGAEKAGLEKKRDENWNWKNIPDEDTRKLIEELAYFLYEINRLDVFPDLVTLLAENPYTGLLDILQLIAQAREAGSLRPFLLALGRLKFKKNADLLAILLDRLEYYPSDYISIVLRQDNARFLEDVGITKGVSYKELVSSGLFWFSRRPKELLKVQERLRVVKDRLGEELFTWALKEFGLHALTNNLILEEAIEIELDSRLTILVHPCVIPYLREKLPQAKIGRSLFFFGSYTKLAQSGISQGDFKRFLNWNFKARQTLVRPATIDNIALEQMITATDRMFYYYKALFPDDDLLPQIESGWSKITKETRELVTKNGPLPADSKLAQKITLLGETKGLDSIETIHGFINFIHQRGIDKRYSPKSARVEGGAHGGITTALFSSDGVILDRTSHSFVVGKNSQGMPVYMLPEELRYILRNLLFFMNPDYHLTECRLDITGAEIIISLPIGEHSAGLSINLSQPQQGGMIQLQWDEGNNEAGNILRQDLMENMLTGMGFSVTTDSALLNARYDSQTGARTVKDIMDTGGRVLRLITGTRDLDFLLSQASKLYYDIRKDLSLIWFFGMPTFRRMLQEKEAQPYLQIFEKWGGPIREALNGYLKGLGLDQIPEHIPFGINMINTYFNKQIDRAIGRQELIYDNEGRLIKNPHYEEPSQVRTFAELLQDPAQRENLIIMARLLHDVNKIAPGRVTDIGGINGYIVRRLQLEFPGNIISLWGLYHPTGQILAGYGALGDRLNRITNPETDGATDNVITSPQGILDLLRGQGLYLSRRLLEISQDELRIRDQRLERSLGRPQFVPLANLGASVRFDGMRVSDGLSTGKAVFNMPVKSPEDFIDAVLVASYTTPEDEPRMEMAEAIVTTGGGPLTHTGIIARELRKPSLIISGEWDRIDGETVILAPYEIFTRKQERVGGYTIIRRVGINPKTAIIREGDILTVDATSGTLYNWGQTKEILEVWRLTRSIQDRKDWRAWDRLLEIARDTTDKQVIRFLIHKIFAGRLSYILELEEKIGFVTSLSLNTAPGDEGRRFLNELLKARTDELYTLIREYRVRVKNSNYPREIVQLIKEVKERYNALTLLYNVLRQDVPESLLEYLNGLEVLSNTQLQRLRAKILSQLELLKKGAPGDARQMRRIRNLWRDAGYISKIVSLDLRRFSSLAKGLQEWEDSQKARAGQLAGRDTLPLKQIDMYCTPLTGAKAANLGEIARIVGKEFIPDGFSITDHAFCRFMGFNNLWARIEKIISSHKTPDGKYKLVREAFNEASWPEDLEGEILEQYHKLEKDMTLEEKEEYIKEIVDKALSGESSDACEMIKGLFVNDKKQKLKQWQRMTISEIVNQIEPIPQGMKERLLKYNEEQGGPMVAVRSSTVGGEDSPEASFAGEMETYQYQRGREAILFHIKRCMASLWTPRVISYREWHGYPQTGLHTSVFIQLMVDTRASAVGFTVDPASGDWNQIVLNAGWGSGMGIMGGEVDTDFYLIDKYTALEDGVVQDIRAKPTMYIFDLEKGRGVRQAEVPPSMINAAALGMEEIGAIRSLLIKLERYWGVPRDIELGIDKGGDIKILQDRPVTALYGGTREKRRTAAEDVLTFGDAIKRFDGINRKVLSVLSQGMTPVLNKQELQIIILVLFHELKPARIRENRQLHDKGVEAVDLIIKLRNAPDLLEALITEATDIAKEKIQGIRIIELKSLIPYILSQCFFYSDEEGLKRLDMDGLREYLTLLLSDPYLKGYLNIVASLEAESVTYDKQYKIYLGLGLFYKKKDGGILPFNIGLREALQRLRALKNSNGRQLVEIEFLSSHTPGETHEIMQNILGNEASNFKVNYSVSQIPTQGYKTLFVISQTDPFIAQISRDMALIFPQAEEGQFISGRGLLMTALAWLECGGKAEQQFPIAGPKSIPLTKEYERILAEEAAMNRSV